ncbi:MAG: exodeoxyribonuclease III [Hyphomicrobiales bacterium]
MPLKLATWNINSVRLRLELILRFLKEIAPDVLCLQETKCPDDRFPVRSFKELGYEHIAIRGQAGYNGVAIISRIPLSEVRHHPFCNRPDTRHIAVTLQTESGALALHNAYVPAGGDIPDPMINEKFAHKLAFLKEMRDWFGDAGIHGKRPMVLVGDLNIAPLATDVWSHKQLLNVVSHTPVEVEALNGVQEAHGFIDVVRRHIPVHERLYSWWSYRARDWRASNRGRRLDHIWVSPLLGPTSLDAKVLDNARDWTRPSDHVPVIATFDLARGAGRRFS